MAEAVIVAGVRTPFVKAWGPLAKTSASELGRLAVRELFRRTNVNPCDVDELIAGTVANPADSANVARVIALKAGLPNDRIAHTVSRNCASGFECITQAVEAVRSGRATSVVAVGVESMSNIPVMWSEGLTDQLWKLNRSRGLLGKLKTLTGARPSQLKPVVGVQLGLTDPVCGLVMGETAEKLAREFGVTREEQDDFAFASHKRTADAWKSGRLGEEVMTVYPEPKFEPVESDVGYRPDQTIEALAKLKPYFDRRYGSVTVGNSSQITDGAVAVLVMDEAKAKACGLERLGRIRAYAYAGCDPSRMGLGPVYAVAKLLKQTGGRLADFDLIELNEAFAAQVLSCIKAFASDDFAEKHLSSGRLGEVDMSRLNVNGGAIALGHPVGASGARLILTLLEELRRRSEGSGLATLCVGGGQGGAVAVER